MRRLALPLLLWLPLGAVAHHSLSGQFDTARSVHLEGRVTRVDWTNPHVYLHVEVREADGGVATWRVESLPVAMMRKAGLTRQQLLAEGQTLALDVYPARSGAPHLGYLLHLKFPDGRYIQFNKVPGAEQP